jgi:hypothetical protein
VVFSSNISHGKLVTLKKLYLSLNGREFVMDLIAVNTSLQGAQVFSAISVGSVATLTSHRDDGAQVVAIAEYEINQKTYNISSTHALFEFAPLFESVSISAFLYCI